MMASSWMAAAVVTGLLLLALALPARAEGPAKVVIRVGGSSSLVESAEIWEREYSQTHPDVVIIASGGGTSPGFQRLFDREADAVFAAQQISDEDSKTAATRSLSQNKPVKSPGLAALSVRVELTRLQG